MKTFRVQKPVQKPVFLEKTGFSPAAVFLLFVALTLLFTYPLPLYVTTSLYNWSDSLLNTWTLAWGTHALLTDPLNLYNANIFYPYQNTLAYSESLIPQTLLAIPVILTTNMPAFAHNLLVLASFVLSAFGMYLLVFDLTRHRGAGIIAGLIYTFTSYKLMHFGHLQLLSSQWLPFALLYLRRILNSKFEIRNSKFEIRNSILFAFFFALQALASFYYAFFVAMAAGLYIACVLVLRGWRWWRGRGAKVRSEVSTQTVIASGAKQSPLLHMEIASSHRTLLAKTRSEQSSFQFPFGALVISFGLIAVLTIPPSLPYFAVQRDLGLERDLHDVEYYVATARTYFSVPDNNLLYSSWLAPKGRMTGSGERDFVGLVALGLAAVGLFAKPRRDAEKWFYLLLGAVGLVLSFGARAEILLFPRWPKISLPFFLPYHYLFLWVPGFKAMRGPDRFAYLVVLAIAVLAGYGTRAVLESVRALRRPHPAPTPSKGEEGRVQTSEVSETSEVFAEPARQDNLPSTGERVFVVGDSSHPETAQALITNPQPFVVGDSSLPERAQALTTNRKCDLPRLGLTEVVGVILITLVVLENLALPVRLTNPATLARPLPDAQQWLAARAPGAVILELPMRYDKEFLAWPQYYSVFHWRKLANGFSGFFPPGFGDLAKLLDENFPSDDSLAVLDALGVRYVTVDKNLLTKPELQAVNERVARFADRVHPEQDTQTGAVYRVDARGWGQEIAALIPRGARVELANERGDRRVLFEIIAAFLPERTLSGTLDAAFRSLPPSAQIPDFVITNADADPPLGFARRVWANEFVAVYAQ